MKKLKNVQRMAIVVLILSMLVAALTGCQGKNEESPAAQTSDESSIAVNQTDAPDSNTTDQPAEAVPGANADAPQPPAKTDSDTTGANANNAQNSIPDSEEMKKNMETGINSLVAAGTIDQAQADQVLEALTSRAQSTDGQDRPKKTPQSGQDNNEQNGQPTPPQDGKPNNRGGGSLSKLVEDNVITQAQADAIMEKIQENPLKNN
ncbi:MAG: hypothetical protein APF77_13735 [Clostridia bacterium BRH_c25]|nr:MAG: hypothetical protein APF77_13735 [Clostridia bacterium BRH_c25]